jgi:hypothetical protein
MERFRLQKHLLYTSYISLPLVKNPGLCSRQNDYGQSVIFEFLHRIDNFLYLASVYRLRLNVCHVYKLLLSRCPLSYLIT